MRWFPKLAAVLLVALFAGSAIGGGAKDAAVPVKKEAAKKKKPKAGDAEEIMPDAKEGGKVKKVEIPVAKDHPAKGLKIPYLDGDGKLQMVFTIGVASRIDDEHIQMADMKVEMFDETGEPDMTIDLPDSVMNQDTKVISTKKHMTIRRSDFELTAEAMEFNTETKIGTFGGGVRMLIYDLTGESAAQKTAHPDSADPSTPDPKTP